MKLAEKVLNMDVKISEAKSRIKASSVHAANLQGVIASVETHLASLGNAIKYVEDDKNKKIIENLLKSFLDSLEMQGVDVR